MRRVVGTGDVIVSVYHLVHLVCLVALTIPLQHGEAAPAPPASGPAKSIPSEVSMSLCIRRAGVTLCAYIVTIANTTWGQPDPLPHRAVGDWQPRAGVQCLSAIAPT